MAKTTLDNWDPGFLEKSPIFDSVREASLPFILQAQWPTLSQFSTEFKKRNIQSHNDVQIQPVAQAAAPKNFEDHYESRIYLKGELQTRLENWHDFFNAMCWMQFPKTKAALNALHYERSKTRQAGSNRSPLENAITLFDECGAVIVADDEAILDLVRGHEWKDLFWKNECWDNQDSLGRHVQCYVFGHAMHEKTLTPYLGMTAHTLVLKQNSDFFQKDYSEQLSVIDQIISDAWLNKAANYKIESPKDLHAFPLLGVPGWWSEKQGEQFYSNTGYFRSKKRP
jgi:Protein of unknown function (DUF3025)